MNKCIYFKETSPKVNFDKAEHIIPAGIGGIKKLPKGMVSDEANELFSKLELEFMRDSIISIPRQFHGPGKRGSLSKGKATKSHIHILSDFEHMDDLSLGYVSLSQPHIIPQIKIHNNKEFTFHTENFTRSYEEQYSNFINELKDYEKRVQSIIDKSIPIETIVIGHLKDQRNNKFYIAVNNEEKLESLPKFINKLIGGGCLKTDNADSNKYFVTSHQSIAFNINNYSRVCAKIAFNYLASIKGSEFVLQDIFDPIRKFIIDSSDNKFVFMNDDSKENSALDILNDSYSHLITVFKENNKLIAVLCLYGNNFKTTIVLSDNFKDKFTNEIYICNWSEKQEDSLWNTLVTL